MSSSIKKNGKRRSVTVVAAPSSSFPDFSAFSAYNNITRSTNTSKKSSESDKSITSAASIRNSNEKGIEIDFDETVKEIKLLGSTQFTGKQKRKYEDEQYIALTGREKKKQKVPLKIVRGIKKKAAERERRIEEENKEAGIVTHTSGTNKKKVMKRYNEQNRKDSRVHGPAPSIGWTRNGVVTVRKGR